MLGVKNEKPEKRIVQDPYNVIDEFENEFKPTDEKEIINKEATENFQIPLDLFLQKQKSVEPSITIRLPSVGKAGYDETIKLKPLLTKHQKIIAKTPYFSRFPVYIDILKERIETTRGLPINVLNLTKGDFNFILSLYQISLSPTLNFVVNCGKCNQESEISVNIETDLEKNPLVNNILEEVLIYDDKVKVIFEIPRISHLLNIYEYLMKEPQQLTQTEMKLHEMAFCLKEVFLVEDKSIISFQDYSEKIRFMNEIHAEEILKLENCFDKFDHGIENTYKFICPKCKNEEIINLPIENEFDFFQLNEIEKLESILETQFLLAKTAGIDLSDSDVLDPTTRNLMLKIINDFYQKIEEARGSNK